MPSLLGRPPPYAGSGACACLHPGKAAHSQYATP